MCRCVWGCSVPNNLRIIELPDVALGEKDRCFWQSDKMVSNRLEQTPIAHMPSSSFKPCSARRQACAADTCHFLCKRNRRRMGQWLHALSHCWHLRCFLKETFFSSALPCIAWCSLFSSSPSLHLHRTWEMLPFWLQLMYRQLWLLFDTILSEIWTHGISSWKDCQGYWHQHLSW